MEGGREGVAGKGGGGRDRVDRWRKGGGGREGVAGRGGGGRDRVD